MTKQQRQQQQQKPFPYEFGGPVGAAATTLLLPIVVLLLAHWSRVGRVTIIDILPSSYYSPFDAIVQSPVLCPNCPELLSWWSTPVSNYDEQQRQQEEDGNESRLPVLVLCALGVAGWFLFQVLLERFLPGPVVEGAPIIVVKNDNDKNKNGKPKEIRLPYRMNGHLAFWVTVLLVSNGWPVFENHRVASFTTVPFWNFLYERFACLALATSVLCFIGSTLLYLHSFRPINSNDPSSTNRTTTRVLADGGNSGNAVYDHFMGRELNPRGFFGGDFDWKVFCELRPGLIGWVLLNVSAAVQQQSELGYVSNSMILINVFHGIYVWDALYQERAILTTMDVTTDGFGFMLLFGDLCWVPFTYSLQARYLVRNDPELGFVALLFILAVHGFGYYVFRGANGQKDLFRKDPNDPRVRDLKYLQTKRGTKLLTSGWWGRARKINYTGDYIMGLSWCMVCGFQSIVPYYYVIYFAILLVHRSIRDDHMCQTKYGDDWITYKKLVPYRFIPGVV